MAQSGTSGLSPAEIGAAALDQAARTAPPPAPATPLPRRSAIPREFATAGTSLAPTLRGGLGNFAPSGSPFANGSVLGGPAKPFSNVVRPPTVSPYLQLFDTGIGGGQVDNFNNVVRPQLQQSSFNPQFARQQQLLNQRVQQISAQPAYTPTGSNRIIGTGHPTGFNFTGRYYPGRR